VLVYSFVIKVISSVFKSLLVVLGLALLIGGIYVSVLSAQEPVNILNLYEVDNFRIKRLEK